MLSRIILLAMLVFSAAMSPVLALDAAPVKAVHQATTDSRKIDYRIAEQLALPEDKIDIGIAALTFAKEEYPDIDIAAYSKRIDALADKVRQLANGTRDPERRIRVLNTVLFRMEGFHYDHSPNSREVKNDYVLSGVLDTKQGTCYGMPLLYIAVAQRVGYPVYPVVAPDHYFARYVDPSFKEQNIEVTSGGKYFEDEWYIRDFAIGKKGLTNGSYLKTMTYSEYLGYMLATNAGFIARRDGNKAITYLEISAQRNPNDAERYFDLSNAYRAKSRAGNAAWMKKYQKIADDYMLKAKELGYVDPAEIDKAREIRGK